MDGRANTPYDSALERFAEFSVQLAVAQTRDELDDLLETAGSSLFSADCLRLSLVDTGEPDAKGVDQGGSQLVVTNGEPLAAGERSYGLLEIVHSKTSPLIEADLAMLARLARVVASHIDRVSARLALRREFSDRNDSTVRLEHLHDLESDLSKTRTILEVIDVLSARITSMVPAARVSFAQLGPEPGQSTVYGIAGMEAVQSGSIISTNDRELKDRFAHCASYYDPDHRLSPSGSVQAALWEVGIGSSMNIGVYVHDRLVGTLNVGIRDLDGLSPGDQALLTTLSSFMGSTLERIDSHARLTYEARHDSLTGLVTRQVFDETLDGAINSLRSEGDLSAICFLDIDRFKMINDTAGHKVGDSVLQEAAARVQACLDPKDVLSRIGGDEFIMILTGRDRAGYEAICANVVAAMDCTPFVADDRLVHCTLSVGLAFIDCDTSSADDAVATADAACYAAKSHGGNRYSVASDADDDQTSRKMTGPLILLIQNAIEHDELQIYGQPIRPIGPDGISAIEVLVRLSDDQGRMLPPPRFIPLAERYGLITALDAWVVQEALALVAAAGLGDGRDVHDRIFINLSPTSLTTEGFADHISRIVRSSGVAPERICFEITETGTMQNFEGALRFVQTLKAIGVEFALDDFGVGLSSLSHLRLLPVDYLKIDGSLIREIATNPLDATMVESIKAMADAMGVKTIAEHIESQRSIDVLRGLGVQNAQGFFLGHPAPLRRMWDIGAREGFERQIVPALG